MLNSFSFFATADFPRRILGPFPAGSVVTRIYVSAIEDGIGTTPGVLLSVAKHVGMPLDSEAGHAGGEQQIIGIGTTTYVVGNAPNTAPAVRIGCSTLSPIEAQLPLDVRFESGGYLSVEIGCADAGQTISGGCGVDVLWPSDDPEQLISVSKPGTVKAPSSAAKFAKAPHVLNRQSAPLPVQSRSPGPTSQPVAPFGS